LRAAYQRPRPEFPCDFVERTGRGLAKSRDLAAPLATIHVRL
jgi:hypothetical protein